MPKGDRDILKADPLDGTTPISNLLLEALAMAHISGEAKGCILFLWRRTYGWEDGNNRKTEDRISLREWALAIDSSEAYASRIVNELVAKRIINRTDLGNGKGYNYSMNTNINQWDKGCLNRQGLSKRYSEGLSKRYTPHLSKKTTPPDTNLATPKEILNKVLKKDSGSKEPPDPRVTEIMRALEKKQGYKFQCYGRDVVAVKRALISGYTPEQFIGCWEKMRNGWWKGKELALARVLGNLGEYAKSSHSDGRIPEHYTEVDDL